MTSMDWLDDTYAASTDSILKLLKTNDGFNITSKNVQRARNVHKTLSQPLRASPMLKGCDLLTLFTNQMGLKCELTGVDRAVSCCLETYAHGRQRIRELGC